MTRTEIEFFTKWMLDIMIASEKEVGRTVKWQENVVFEAGLIDAPGFGASFLEFFQKRGLKLPEAAGSHTYLVRTWGMLNFDWKDDIVCGAMILHLNPCTVARDILQALTVIKDLPLERIAEIVHLPIRVVECYHELFWNIRPRINEVPYMTQIIYPKTIKETFRPDYLSNVEPRLLLLRAAWEHQDPELVLRLAGANPNYGKDRTPGQMAQEFEKSIMLNGQLAAIMGGLNQPKMPGIEHAKAIVCASKRSRQDQPSPNAVMGIDALGSLEEDMMEEVRRITRGGNLQAAKN